MLKFSQQNPSHTLQEIDVATYKEVNTYLNKYGAFAELRQRWRNSPSSYAHLRRIKLIIFVIHTLAISIWTDYFDKRMLFDLL